MLDQPRRPRQQSPRRPGRRPGPPEPAASSGATRWLAVIVGALVVLLVIGRVGREPEAAPAPQSVEGTPSVPAPAPAQPPPPAQAVVESPTPTPTVDLLVRLEAHRRIVRAGSAVYVDSLLAESDSTFRRWAERPGDFVRVAIEQDSLTALVRDAAALARDAFTRWQDHTPGIRFQIIADPDQADVRIGWQEQFDPELARTGETDIDVLSDGTIVAAYITVARRAPDGTPLDRESTLRTLMHEMGHAIGLAHSADPRDVMYPRPRTSALSDRDRRTVDLIYGLPPGSVKGGN